MRGEPYTCDFGKRYKSSTYKEEYKTGVLVNCIFSLPPYKMFEAAFRIFFKNIQFASLHLCNHLTQLLINVLC